MAMNQLMRFPSSVKRDPAIEVWMKAHAGELGAIAQHWFEVMRDYGDDVRELLHDGHPTACLGDAAFAYVNAFTAHVNVGFFRDAEIADPDGLLEGTGKVHASREAQARTRRRYDSSDEADRDCVQGYEAVLESGVAAHSSTLRCYSYLNICVSAEKASVPCVGAAPSSATPP